MFSATPLLLYHVHLTVSTQHVTFREILRVLNKPSSLCDDEMRAVGGCRDLVHGRASFLLRPPPIYAAFPDSIKCASTREKRVQEAAHHAWCHESASKAVVLLPARRIKPHSFSGDELQRDHHIRVCRLLAGCVSGKTIF